MPVNNARQIITMLVAMEVITYATALVLLREIYKQKFRYKKLYEMTGYMLSMLEEHGIELSEFDLIALGDIVKEHNATE